MARSVLARSARAPSASLRRPSAPAASGPGGLCDRGPHALVHRCRDGSGPAFFHKRKIALLEIQRAVGHARQDLSARRANHPFVLSALGQSPCGHLAGSSVRQNPIGPTCVIERERPAEFDRIHAEQIQHVGVNNRELLHGIINAQRLGWQPQMLPQLCVGNRRDPGRAMPGKIDGNPVRLAVLERGHYTFAGCHPLALRFRFCFESVWLLSFHNLTSQSAHDERSATV